MTPTFDILNAQGLYGMDQTAYTLCFFLSLSYGSLYTVAMKDAGAGKPRVFVVVIRGLYNLSIGSVPNM